MSRFLVASAVTAAVTSAANVHDRKFYEEKFFEWLQDFKEHVQVKDGEHFVHMLENFANNHDLIERHNAQNLTYTLGHNQFSHMSFEEWGEYMRFGLGKPDNEPADFILEAPADLSANPATVDWVSAGAVTGVKNQGNCGSCWSFSATGSLEGVYQIKTGTLNSYSEQELVSCDTGGIFGDKGCNGGLMDNAFKWVKSNGGLCLESAYPYVSGTTGQNEACKSHTACDDKTLTVSSYVDVTQSDGALETAIAKTPTSVAIQANQPAFQLYNSGVLTGTCGANLDHGVLAVGYGTDATGGAYYNVKNSWGTTWGEKGYIRIARGGTYNGGKGQCGILSGPPSYPVLV